MLNIDKFLRQGKTHQVCQDYIETSDWYVVLADGCSSAKNSEIGAMILCREAMNVLEQWKDSLEKLDYNEFGKNVIFNAWKSALVLNVPEECLNTTLLVAYKFNDHIFVHVYGDGLIITKQTNGNITCTEVSFTKNTPFYLSYLLSPEAFKSYPKEYRKIVTEHHFDILDAEETLFPNDKVTYGYFIENYESILIASDGMTNWTHNPDMGKVAKDMVNFAQPQGAYLQRCMNFLIRGYEKSGYYEDDIAVGGFLNLDTWRR